MERIGTRCGMQLASLAAVVTVLASAMLGWAQPAAADASRAFCVDVEVAVALSPAAPAEHRVSGTLCRPRGASSRLQILLSGASYGRLYWDPPGRGGRYSYVRAAVAAGDATLNIDRIGVGESSHPPADSVTVASQAYVTHQLVQAARSSGLAGATWSQVVTVGHSLGSAIALVEAARYQDVDGLIVTGFLAHAVPVGAAELIANLQPAQLEPRFANRPAGYLTTAPGSRGRLFYHLPAADKDVIALDERTKETLTPSELATLSDASQASVDQGIRVPVLSVTGEFDNVFCANSCRAANSPAHLESQHYPNAPCFTSYVVPGAGHAINLHRTAPAWFANARAWLHVDRASGCNDRASHGSPPTSSTD